MRQIGQLTVRALAMTKAPKSKNQPVPNRRVEGLSQAELDSVVGGAMADIFVPSPDPAQTRHPKLDGVVVLSASLPGGRS
jgi:hypothetical protein